MAVSAAVARNNGSVWLLSPRAVRIDGVSIAAPEAIAPWNAFRLIDSNGVELDIIQTTALCIEVMKNVDCRACGQHFRC
jgi:hypothetical protein